jgi:ubiquitin C-terminal hydrolase
LSCSLYDCLSEATIAEPISDYELSDGSRINASKQILFDSLPQVLVLHINRTAWGSSSSQKVHTKVEFPLTLSLGAYKVDGHDTKYELCSIVSHHGNQMSSGHFTAYGRRLGSWHHFNDAKVTPITTEEVLEVQPYILIYERVVS